MPLIDEIGNHVFQWACDPDWKTLPKRVNIVLTELMNELKFAAIMKETGVADDENNIKKDKVAFFTLFKRKYVVACDMTYDRPMEVVEQMNIKRVVERLREEGANYIEFIEWFFDDWLSLEQNKKYTPPSINLICKNFVVDKYLFEMKDKLRIRKKQIDEQGVRNMLLEIALPFARRIKDKDFMQKIMDYSNSVITSTKFLDLLGKFAEKYNDQEVIDACKKMSASGKS